MPLSLGHELKGVRARYPQMKPADRKAFPLASCVVRIGDAEWSSEEDDLLRQLSEVLMRRARERQPCALERLLDPLPRVLHGNEHVYVLFGPRVISVDAENQIQVDIRGLVYEPISRISRKGNLVVNIGADDCS